jgi:hypothetical protein
VARKGQKGQKGPKRPFGAILLVKNSEITVFVSKSANEGLKNNSTTRKHPGKSHHRGTRGHNWPERAKKGQKGPKGPKRPF